MMVPWRASVLCVVAGLAVAQESPTSAADKHSPFISVPSAASDQFQFDTRFPDFEAQDINGRTWRARDLQGKFTLIYIWNTLSARSLDAYRRPRLPQGVTVTPNLPELQRFYNKVKNSGNIQVLTFTTDYDYMHSHEYMKEKNYSFPVIADWVLIGKLFPKDTCKLVCSGGPIPSPSPDAGNLASPQWVVNPQGRLSYPFRSWSLGRLLFEIEKAAAAL
jgi:peroxiredoxin